MPDTLHVSEAESLVRALDFLGPVGPEERTLLKALPLRSTTLAAGQDVVSEGELPKGCCLLVEGVLCRYKHLPSGPRQILSFHFAGDLPDLQSLYLPRLDHHLCALTDCRVAHIPRASISALVDKSPAIGALLWKLTLVEGSVFRQWLTNVGRCPAPARMAHLFCEIFIRLKLRGLTEGMSFFCAMTQHDLADALGLSPVHVNRTLQELRRAGLIRSQARRVLIEDWGGLRDLAGFDPTYLHLRNPLPDELMRIEDRYFPPSHS